MQKIQNISSAINFLTSHDLFIERKVLLFINTIIVLKGLVFPLGMKIVGNFNNLAVK